MNPNTANIQQYNAFAAELMQRYIKDGKNENIILSPFSILMLLALASDATAGETSAEINKILSSNSEAPDFRNWLIDIQKVICSGKAISSATAVCVQEMISESIQPDFTDMLHKVYGGELFASADIVSDVNKWVRKATNGLIDQLADDSMCDMLACLMNAVSYEAEWQVNYEANDIYDDEFTNADGTVKEVPFLHSREDCYIEDDSFTGFTKPYKDVGFSFMALLPKKKKNRSFLVQTLKSTDFTGLYQSRTDQYNLSVSMPEFESSFKDDLTGFCKELGMHKIFTEGADFSPMSTERLTADSIVHKARIEVNRQGTKAAAVTAIYTIGCAPDFSRLKHVELNRPFLYAVVHNETGLPVFTGILNQI